MAEELVPLQAIKTITAAWKERIQGIDKEQFNCLTQITNIWYINSTQEGCGERKKGGGGGHLMGLEECFPSFPVLLHHHHQRILKIS